MMSTLTTRLRIRRRHRRDSDHDDDDDDDGDGSSFKAAGWQVVREALEAAVGAANIVGGSGAIYMMVLGRSEACSSVSIR